MVANTFSRKQFQFTPLREGRPGGDYPPLQWRDISIHAPPRGATGEELELIGKIVISIHAPPRGATATRYPHWYKPFNFNSRPSARGDRYTVTTICKPLLFQFTPLREGRQFAVDWIAVGKYFNSRPSARGDTCCRWHQC